MRKKLLLAILVCFTFYTCKKDAGQGGTSTLKGKVICYEYDASFQQLVDTVQLANEDVYIIYGADHSTYDDHGSTSFDGSYKFTFLQKGKYKLFVYTKDSTGAAQGLIDGNKPKIPYFSNVEITSNGSEVTVPDLIVLKNNK